MGEVIKVGMADLNICKAPDTIQSATKRETKEA